MSCLPTLAAAQGCLGTTSRYLTRGTGRPMAMTSREYREFMGEVAEVGTLAELDDLQRRIRKADPEGRYDFEFGEALLTKRLDLERRKKGPT